MFNSWPTKKVPERAGFSSVCGLSRSIPTRKIPEHGLNLRYFIKCVHQEPFFEITQYVRIVLSF